MRRYDLRTRPRPRYDLEGEMPACGLPRGHTGDCLTGDAVERRKARRRERRERKEQQ